MYNIVPLTTYLIKTVDQSSQQIEFLVHFDVESSKIYSNEDLSSLNKEEIVKQIRQMNEQMLPQDENLINSDNFEEFVANYTNSNDEIVNEISKTINGSL